MSRPIKGGQGGLASAGQGQQFISPSPPSNSTFWVQQLAARDVHRKLAVFRNQDLMKSKLSDKAKAQIIQLEKVFANAGSGGGSSQ